MGAAGEALEGPSSLRYTFADPITANLEGVVTFEAPELPEETLMEVGMVYPRGIKVKQIHALLPEVEQAIQQRARPVRCSESPGHIQHQAL